MVVPPGEKGKTQGWIELGRLKSFQSGVMSLGAYGTSKWVCLGGSYPRGPEAQEQGLG